MTKDEAAKIVDDILGELEPRELEPTRKGTSNMTKKPMTKQAMALMKWRAEHMDKDGKVVVQRRSPDAILTELKKKREFYASRMAVIDRKIRYYDTRINADRRKELLAQLTTEQLEAIVKRLTQS